MNLSRSIFVLLLTLPSIGRSSQHTANLVDRLFTVYNHQTVALKDENDGRNFSYQQAQRWYNIAPLIAKPLELSLNNTLLHTHRCTLFSSKQYKLR